MLLVAEVRVRNSCYGLSEPKSDETRRGASAKSLEQVHLHFNALPNAQAMEPRDLFTIELGRGGADKPWTRRATGCSWKNTGT